jgi:alkanesulfonate monooxygenase SsuD/methylene tetrahydromethanopterin reductase-like flavin-dependent oxidoreductase (luciferase family)
LAGSRVSRCQARPPDVHTAAVALRYLVRVTGHWSVAGTPDQIADAVEERFRAGVLDVVSLGGLADDLQHEFVVDGLLHELRRRGIVGDGYQGTTLRENLGLPREELIPASR